MEIKRVIRLFSLLLLLLFSHLCFAWNWSGVLKSKIQTDNRYTNDARIFNETWGSLEVFDFKSWHGGLDFVSRQSSEQGIEADIYQLYMEKTFHTLSSKLKLGRYQRSDSMGYYVVDGMNYQYQHANSGATLQMYAGVPRRLEDVRSVNGDWVYGLEAQWQTDIAWKNDFLTFDKLFLRSSFQQFADEHISTRLSFASTATGQFSSDYLQGYELSLMSTYEASTSTFEDFLVNAMIDLSKDLRIRTSYELYQPKEPFIGFREKFYAVYALGRQDLLKGSMHYQFNDYFQYHFGFKRASRNQSEDIGYGGNAGMKWDYISHLSLAAEIDYLELGDDKSESLYLSAAYSMTSLLKTELNIALANNVKKLYGNNSSTGLEIKTRYRLNSEVFFNLSSSYIWYSQLDNEYLLGAQVTWYYDRFQAKLDR